MSGLGSHSRHRRHPHPQCPRLGAGGPRGMNKPLQSCGWDAPRPLSRSSGPSSEVRPSPIVGRAIAPSPARATSPPRGTDPLLPPASLPLTGRRAAALGLAAQGTVVVPASSARGTPDVIRAWDPGPGQQRPVLPPPPEKFAAWEGRRPGRGGTRGPRGAREALRREEAQRKEAGPGSQGRVGSGGPWGCD